MWCSLSSGFNSLYWIIFYTCILLAVTSCGFLPESFRTPQGVQFFKDQSFRILEDSLSFSRQSLTTPQAVLESPHRVLEQSSDSSPSPQNSSKLLRSPWGSLGQCHVLVLCNHDSKHPIEILLTHNFSICWFGIDYIRVIYSRQFGRIVFCSKTF